MYIRTGCGFCRRAKELLTGKGVDFEEIETRNHPEEWKKIKEQTGRTTVPQIFIDSFHIGGCDDLMAMNARGELDQRLGLTTAENS